MNPVKSHPLTAFFVLTYTLTWGFLPLGTFMAAGPLLAALTVIAISQGRAGLRELGSRLIRWRVGWRWYLVALGVPLAALGLPDVVSGWHDAANGGVRRRRD